MYRMLIKTPRETRTKEIVETKEWLIGRLIRVNGNQPTSKQRQAEDERLSRLLADASFRRKESQQQGANEHQVRELLKALPEAFLYEYGSSDDNANNDTLVKLNFRPNPRFLAPSRKLEVLRGMSGTMMVDRTVDRLARLQGKLLRDVNFGFGILAHLSTGGTFLLEQRNVGGGRWEIATLSLHFTGRLLLFKSLNIDTTIRTSDFRRMSDDLTLIEGLNLLKKQDEMATQQLPK
jgi:hypothetical protein